MSFFTQFMPVPNNTIRKVKADGTSSDVAANALAAAVWSTGVVAVLLGDGTYTQTFTTGNENTLIDLTGVSITNGVHILAGGTTKTCTIVCPNGIDPSADGEYFKPGTYSIVQDVAINLAHNSVNIGRSYLAPGDGNYTTNYYQKYFTGATFVRNVVTTPGVDVFYLENYELSAADAGCTLFALNVVTTSTWDSANVSDQYTPNPGTINFVGGTVTSAGAGGTNISRCLASSQGAVSAWGTVLNSTGSTGKAAYGAELGVGDTGVISLFGCTVNASQGTGTSATCIANLSTAGTINANSSTLANLHPAGSTSGTILTVSAVATPVLYDTSTICYDAGIGSDTTGDGTIARPFATQAHAASFTTSGDTVTTVLVASTLVAGKTITVNGSLPGNVPAPDHYQVSKDGGAYTTRVLPWADVGATLDSHTYIVKAFNASNTLLWQSARVYSPFVQHIPNLLLVLAAL